MNDEMLQSQRLVRLHGSNQLKRIKEGADEAFAPARVAETALKMYAKAMQSRLAGIIADAEKVMVTTRERMDRSKEMHTAHRKAIEDQYKNELETETFERKQARAQKQGERLP
ncbi:MAG: hypothetical protein HOK23_06835 [Euryarchaeota archaeon]|nr:hypothetical protein [Euryarchaeota archaeon]